MSDGGDDPSRVGEGAAVTEREWLGDHRPESFLEYRDRKSTIRPVTYIAGPMTGYEDYNYPAFHAVEEVLIRQTGHGRIINPAKNFGGYQLHPRSWYMKRAIGQVLDADKVVVLPGWVKSKGARLEVRVALSAGIPVHRYFPITQEVGGAEALVTEADLKPTTTSKTWDAIKDVRPPNPESLVTEANRLVNNDRQADYGHPWDDFSRTARMWAAILDTDITPEQVALCMVGLKLSREVNKPKRDNKVDAIGYLLTLDMVQERRKELGA